MIILIWFFIERLRFSLVAAGNSRDKELLVLLVVGTELFLVYHIVNK